MMIPSFEPLLPSTEDREIEDLATQLIAESSRLAGQLHPIVRESVGDLVRGMNCYYSNLIEGHDTHPRDIERAMASDYSGNPERRVLQYEARAHIEVQRLVDTSESTALAPASREYIMWLHREFCNRLPDDLLWISDPETKARHRVIPGSIRTYEVRVGKHIPPLHSHIGALLDQFERVYANPRLSAVQRVIAVGAAHHRFLWVHPFLDGNGRVARLLSHAMFRAAGVGSSLWSVARGLSRFVGDYRAALADADSPRRGDFDGRGALSMEGLRSFVIFFLRTSLDQVRFMERLLQPSELLRRMKLQVDDEVSAGTLPRGSMEVLREALLLGEIERGKASSLTGYQERRARDVLSSLVERRLLVSDTPKGLVRLGLPLDVVERWFPTLFPGDPGKSPYEPGKT